MFYIVHENIFNGIEFFFRNIIIRSKKVQITAYSFGLVNLILYFLNRYAARYAVLEPVKC